MEKMKWSYFNITVQKIFRTGPQWILKRFNSIHTQSLEDVDENESKEESRIIKAQRKLG